MTKVVQKSKDQLLTSQMDTVEKALARERERINFDPVKLSHFLYTPKFYPQLLEVLQKYDVPPHDFNHFNGGRVACIKDSIRNFPIIYNNVAEKGLDDINTTYILLASMNQMPGTVHLAMFMRCIEILGTDRQQKEYLEKCRTFEIVGAYAQTEIAHGSDVSSLMTTATLDLEKDEIVMNTPNIKAIKFWPGEMGIYSTHALVFAQLIVEGKKLGVHSFVVPIRDKDLNLLPGVEAGDIGPKIGFHSKDNGYLILKGVRISRKNMLTRYLSITKDGKLKVKGDPKISYATMMDIRKHLSSVYPKIYSQGITIAVRYSLFRKQFMDVGKQEIPIANYQLQQEKLLGRVAEFYAITMAGNRIKDICNQNIAQVKEKEDFSLMAQTHACLSLGKPYFGEIVYDGLEICRRACGGHGYSQYSGLPSLINEYASNNTLEGENTVLYLQVSRYLLKSFKHFKMKKKALGQSVKYIESFDNFMAKRIENETASAWSMDDLRVLLAQSVCQILNETTMKLMKKQEGYSDKDAWNFSAGIRLRQLAMLHAAYFTFDSFMTAVLLEKDQRIREITQDLCLLYGIDAITSSTVVSSILEGGFLRPEQIDSLMELKELLLKKLRPDLIGIVDGFGIPDKYFRSALIYGNPYENYAKLARDNQMNHARLDSVNLINSSITKVITNPNASL